MAEFQYTRLDAYEGYDMWAPLYDFWKHPVAAMSNRYAVRILSPEPGERVLDAGCGSGRNLSLIQEAGAEAVGIDFSEAMLGLSVRRAPGAEIKWADLQEPLPFEDGTFDAVLCSLAAEHVENLTRTLREFLRILKPSGRLVLTLAHPDFDGVVTAFRHQGDTFYIPTYGRSIQDYLDCVANADFGDIVFRGFNADSELIETLPTAAVHLGKPVLLLIAATVASGEVTEE